jgi:hypothetical protein
LQDPLFHTFHCSKNHSVRVGLSWDEERAAQSFLNSVLGVLSRPENIGLSGPKSRGTSRPVSWLLLADASAKAAATRTKAGVSGKAAAGSQRKALSKTDISSPVGFCHNVSLNIDNLPRHFAVPASTRSSSFHQAER